jgi:hypothetical protein
MPLCPRPDLLMLRPAPVLDGASMTPTLSPLNRTSTRLGAEETHDEMNAEKSYVVFRSTSTV